MLELMARRILSCILRCLGGGEDQDDEENVQQLHAPLLTSISNGDRESHQQGLLVALEEPCQDLTKPFLLLACSSKVDDPPNEAPVPIQECVDKEGEVKLWKVVVKEVWMKHYCSRHRILLVGEGDFSFSASLAAALGTAAAVNIVATSLDSQEFLIRNYKKAMANISCLRARGCLVMHKLDATKMADEHGWLKEMKFDRIVFNFPHAGFFPKESTESQIRRHQKLIRMFLENAKKLMKEDGGEVHITHKTNRFHRRWDIEGLASRAGLRLVAREKFRFMEYPGYNTKYGFGGNRNFNCNPSSTYRFGVHHETTTA